MIFELRHLSIYLHKWHSLRRLILFTQNISPSFTLNWIIVRLIVCNRNKIKLYNSISYLNSISVFLFERWEDVQENNLLKLCLMKLAVIKDFNVKNYTDT